MSSQPKPDSGGAGAGVSPEMASSSNTPARPKTWSVGTLTYTAAGLAAVFFWLLFGDFAWALKERSGSAIVQLILKKYEASDLLSGLFVGSIPYAAWVVLGPIIGYHSDRHRSRWGRRIPYLLITTPIAVFGIIGLAGSEFLGRKLHESLGFSLNASTIVAVGIFWTIFELATVAGNSVFYGLINDVVPSALIGRFYGLFRALSLGAGMFFNYYLFGKAESHTSGIFLGIGAAYGVGFMLMSVKVKEGEYPPPEPQRTHGLGTTKVYLRECFTHGYYLWLYSGIAFSWMGMAAISLFTIYFAKSLGMSIDSLGKYIALSYSISLVMSYPIGWAADKFHPLRAGLVVLVISAAVSAWAGYYTTTIGIFAAVYVAQTVLQGAWQTVSASLPQRLLPRQKFAQYNSAVEAVKNLGMMLVGPLLGAFLDISDHAYRYTYFVGFVCTALSIVSLLVVERKFRRLGGPARYVAPE